MRALLIDTLVQIREGATGPLVKLLDHEEPAVRMQAAGALGRINEPEAIEPLAGLLRDGDRAVRRAAIEALAQFDRNAFEALDAALCHTDEELRDAVMMTLGLMGRASTPFLVEKLDSPDADIRRRMARTLGIVRDGSALARLIDALADPDVTVRDSAAWALGELQDPRARTPLVAALNDTSMPPQYSLSAWALVKYDPDTVIPDLLDSLRADSPWVRWRAALSLGLFRDPRGVEPLIRALGDTDLEVRRRVIASLGEIGEREAIEPLKRMLIDDIGDDWILVKQTITKIQTRRPSGNARGRDADHYTETRNGTNGNQTLPH